MCCSFSQGGAGNNAPKFAGGGQGQVQKGRQGQARASTAAQRIGQQRLQQQQQKGGGRRGKGQGRAPLQLQGVSWSTEIVCLETTLYFRELSICLYNMVYKFGLFSFGWTLRA